MPVRTHIKYTMKESHVGFTQAGTDPILRGQVHERGYPALQETPIETKPWLNLIGRSLNINSSSKAISAVTKKGQIRARCYKYLFKEKGRKSTEFEMP